MGSDYATQDCAIARALEVVGERWTLLVIRDLFYGVRRYSDLRRHIGLPPATLTDRLNRLTAEGVATRVPGTGARDEYVLTEKGRQLWPALSALAQWGNEHYVDADCRMSYRHRGCDAPLDAVGACTACGRVARAEDVVIQKPASDSSDPFAAALREPHRLLEPLRV